MLKGLFILVPLILVVALGALLQARGFFTAEDKDRLTRLLYWVALPAFLFRSMYMSGAGVLQEENLFLAVYASFLVVPALALLVAYIRHPGSQPMQALCTMMASRANNVYLGLPAVVLAMGPRGLDVAAVCVAVILPGYNVIPIIWGEALMHGGLSPRALKNACVRMAYNPLIVSCLLGLAAGLISLPVPESLLHSLKFLGDMAAGIALLSLGMSLDFSHLPAAFKRTWPDVLIKLVAHPGVLWLFFLLWPVPETMLQAAVILCAMPSAVNSFILAKGMGMDVEYACETIALTTLLAPISIAVWVAFLGI